MITITIYAALTLLFILVDQLTKAWAAFEQVNFDLFWGFRFTYTKNFGVAFGMFNDNPAMMVVISILSVVLSVGIIVASFTLFKNNRPAQFTLAIINAGAIGNLIDRFALGYVRDFVDLRVIGFAICNIADFCITLGAVALFLIIMFVGKDAVIPLGKSRNVDEGQPAPDAEDAEITPDGEGESEHDAT